MWVFLESRGSKKFVILVKKDAGSFVRKNVGVTWLHTGSESITSKTVHSVTWGRKLYKHINSFRIPVDEITQKVKCEIVWTFCQKNF